MNDRARARAPGVLVTGATTPVGRQLVLRLLEGGTPCVLAVGIEPEGDLSWVRDRDRLVYRSIDLTRSRDVRRLLFGLATELRIGAIVHTALHRSALDTGRRVRALNVETTRSLLHLAEDHPTIERFVYRSFAEVYRLEADLPTLIGEEHPLRLATRMTQRVRDRIEADLTVCTRMGLAPHLSIAVLRFAELCVPDSGSQLHDYLSSRVCFRPIGFDPILNVVTIDDAVQATLLALRSDAQGVFNIPGTEVLPLSEVIRLAGRVAVPVPGFALGPLYRMRTRALGADFRYDISASSFHFSGVLDGTRAREVLGYEPGVPVDWAAVAASVRS